jgi:hypothetical protein
MTAPPMRVTESSLSLNQWELETLNMVLEGKKPCIRIHRRRLQSLNGALIRAGYERHKQDRFKKEDEIGAWIAPTSEDRWIHVQVVDAGTHLELFAHTEPSQYGLFNTIDHAVSALTEEGINFGAGCRKLRADLEYVGFRF